MLLYKMFSIIVYFGYVKFRNILCFDIIKGVCCKKEVILVVCSYCMDIFVDMMGGIKLV